MAVYVPCRTGKGDRMISNLTYSSRKKELSELESVLHKEAALAGNEEWNWNFEDSIADVQKDLTGIPVLDLSCFDVSSAEGLTGAEQLRKRYREVLLMVIADGKMSPMAYLKPSVMPASLLLRPYTAEQMRNVIHEFIAAFMQERDTGQEDQYVIETREGKTLVPIRKVSYFEASQKKILIRVGSLEYETYDTMDRLAETLPDYFLRTHRGFIVNTKEIDHIKLSENLVYMKNHSVIPVSRSYRADVKNLWKSHAMHSC